jgi:hypothetical protein
MGKRRFFQGKLCKSPKGCPFLYNLSNTRGEAQLYFSLTADGATEQALQSPFFDAVAQGRGDRFRHFGLAEARTMAPLLRPQGNPGKIALQGIFKHYMKAQALGAFQINQTHTRLI